MVKIWGPFWAVFWGCLGVEKVKLQVLLLVGTWPMLLLLQSAL